MVSLHSLLLNVAQNFRISAPDSQQLSQDLSQNHSISCPNMEPLILTSHQDERFLKYEVKASCLLNETLHRHCIVMETGCSDYPVLGQVCFLHHRSRLDHRHMHSIHFAAFCLKGHYSGVIILSDVLLSGVDASNGSHETFSGRLRASRNVASQHVFCAFSRLMCQNGLNLFTRVGISLLAVYNRMRGGSFCSPD